ncbi:MAG: hypothetical protein AAF583_01715 [Pseudomonadota bacterium]
MESYKDLAARLNLSDREKDGLACCVGRSETFKEAEWRTAYIPAKLKGEGLVDPLWFHDEEADEIGFSWQRSVQGEGLFQHFLSLGYVVPPKPAA